MTPSPRRDELLQLLSQLDDKSADRLRQRADLRLFVHNHYRLLIFLAAASILCFIAAILINTL